MNDYRGWSAAILGVGVALVQVQAVQAISTAEISKTAENITVMIQDVQNPALAGSGVIIKRDGQTYTVLTARHVVEATTNFRVMTVGEKQYPVQQGSIQKLPGVDLALIQFTSSESYSVAKMGDSSKSPLGTASFVGGFPGTTQVRSQPSFYFTSGAIAANANKPLADGYAIAYSNPTLPGMSGGPVLNEQGELIGIHGRGEETAVPQNAKLREDIYVLKTQFNYAVPINTFLILAPQVNKTLTLKIPNPSVSSAPKADDFFLQADRKLNNLDYKGALVDYDQAIRMNPNFSNAYLGRASARSYLSDKQGAMDDLNQAIRVNPNNVRAYAERGISQIFEDRKAAEADLKKALSLNIDTKDAVAYRRRGSLRMGLDDFKGAIADFNQALRINPNFAEAYRSRGVARSELDDVQGAITDCFQALHIKPDFALADLCIMDAAQGEINRKDTVAYDQAIQRYPNSAAVYYHRGVFRERLGDKKDALADYDRAIHINLNYDSAYSSRGRIRFELGDKQGALADFDQVIHLSPKDYHYLERGRFRSESGDKKGAIADFEQVMRLEPKGSIAYIERGKVRADLGDKQGALADFEQVFRLHPNYSAYIERGKVRFKFGDKKGALADLDQVMRLNPNMAHDVHLERGKVRFALGDKQGAISDFQQAAALFKRLAASDDKSLRALGEKGYQDALKWLQRVNGR
jgi:tetratricopeptide (TPR) repeat protein